MHHTNPRVLYFALDNAEKQQLFLLKIYAWPTSWLFHISRLCLQSIGQRQHACDAPSQLFTLGETCPQSSFPFSDVFSAALRCLVHMRCRLIIWPGCMWSTVVKTENQRWWNCTTAWGPQTGGCGPLSTFTKFEVWECWILVIGGGGTAFYLTTGDRFSLAADPSLV